MPSIFAFDPSINDIGWCIRDRKNQWEGGTISLPPEYNLHQRLKRIKDQLNFLQTIQPIQQLVYETPMFMGSAKGKIAAQKGYTIDLGIVCGFIIGVFDVGPFDTFGYTPMQWKGTVPKRATQAKYLRTFPAKSERLAITDHEIDATMLLYHHCQKMKYI